MEVKDLLDKYLIYDSAEVIQRFIIDDLSNWYLRLARKRFLDIDQKAYNIAYYIFDKINRCMAPFVPFLT
jgi:isoleucyl-tRNA synthetase